MLSRTSTGQSVRGPVLPVRVDRVPLVAGGPSVPVDRARLNLMSLPILNEDQDISPQYRRLLERTWAPARVAAAAVHHHGAGVLPGLYASIARRIFAGDDHYRVIHHDLDRVIAEALADSALPAHLAPAAHSTAYDELSRASHNAGMALVGRGVGTPIVHIGGAGFFGRVLTGVPHGADAVRIFDGMRLLAGCHTCLRSSVRSSPAATSDRRMIA